jgi:hypothetical protein
MSTVLALQMLQSEAQLVAPVLGLNLVYCWNGYEVYRKSTGRCQRQQYPRVSRRISTLRAYYHQQYLAKNPGGYCPDHSCGVTFESADLQAGEKAP